MNAITKLFPRAIETQIVHRGEGEWVEFKECTPPPDLPVAYINSCCGQDIEFGEFNQALGKMLRLPYRNILDELDRCKYWTRLPKGLLP